MFSTLSDTSCTERLIGNSNPCLSVFCLLGNENGVFGDIHGRSLKTGVKILQRRASSFTPYHFILHLCSGANRKALLHGRPFWHIFPTAPLALECAAVAFSPGCQIPLIESKRKNSTQRRTNV